MLKSCFDKMESPPYELFSSRSLKCAPIIKNDLTTGSEINVQKYQL